MKLVLLGSGGYHPSEARHTACLALPQQGIVLDAGTGMFRLRPLIATDELDIFLSHSHLDHVVGLTYLYDVLWQRPMRRVTAHGTPATLQAIAGELFAERLFPGPPLCDLRPLAPSVPVGGGGTLTHFPLKHRGGSTGMRIDWPGRSMAYVTDTTADPAAAYVRAIRGVDLLVHECHFRDGWQTHAQETGHSCTPQVAEVARAAAVGLLVLVHVNPLAENDDPVDLEAARRIFPATLLGEDLMEIDF